MQLSASVPDAVASDKPLCFVIMPFGNGNEYVGGQAESDYVYQEVIVPAVVSVMGGGNADAVRIVRELEKHVPGNIPTDIIKNLARADVVIADLTGRNPNVYLELGIRYTLRHSGTILMMQKGGKLPFNIGQMRSVFYSTARWDSDDGRLSLEAALREMLDLVALNQYPGDSPVREIFKTLPPDARDITTDPQGNVMPWNVYWSRIESTVSKLGDLHKNGNFTPDLIVGISKVGLIFADSMSRQAYSNGVPFLTLWAHRPRSEHYFKHPIGEVLNVDLMKNLRRDLRNDARDSPYEILLVDDIIGSTRTMKQAIEFIKGSLDGLSIRITCFVLFSKAS